MSDVMKLVISALTSEDEIAHGEAVFKRDDEFVYVGKCAYDDDPWPCRTQQGIDRLLARLVEASLPTSLPAMAERVGFEPTDP